MPEPQKTKDKGSSKASASSGANTAGQRSFNSRWRDAGFTSFNHFMMSYGLKMHNDDDVQEAKAILRGLYQDESRK